MEYCSREISNAIDKKDYEKLDLLLSSPEIIDYKNGFAIKTALFNNDQAMISYLIDKGANFRLSDEYVLRHACDKGLFSTVQLLVEKGSKINALDCSAFVNAVVNSHWIIADYLLEHDKLGFIKKSKNIYLRTVSKNALALDYLLKKNFVIEDIDKLMIDCVRSNNKEAIDYCLHQGVDLNHTNALCTAIIEKKESLAFYLIEKGSDIHINKEEPIALACQAGFINLVKYFIDHGCLTYNRHNLVKRAVLANSLSLVKLLLEHRQDPHLEEEKALIKAVEKNYVPIIEVLLTKNCNINIGQGVLLKKAIFNKNTLVIEKLLLENLIVTESLKKIAKQHGLIEFIENILVKKSFHDSLVRDLNHTIKNRYHYGNNSESTEHQSEKIDYKKINDIKIHDKEHCVIRHKI